MTCYTVNSSPTPLIPMTNQNEIRLHQDVDLEQQCRNSDTAIQVAMDAASKAAPKGLAPDLLKNAGFAYGQELYLIQEAISKCDPASPIHKLTKQQQLVLTSQGSAWLSALVSEAETYLAEGFPRSAITVDWAMTKVRNIRAAASAERRRLAVPQPTAAEIIATLKEEKEALAAELEKAQQIIAMFQEEN